MRIQPDSDPDPKHWSLVEKFVIFFCQVNLSLQIIDSRSHIQIQAKLLQPRQEVLLAPGSVVCSVADPDLEISPPNPDPDPALVVF